VLSNKKKMEIAELAAAADVNTKIAKKDLDQLIDMGLLGNSAYLNMSTGQLILSPEAAAEDSSSAGPEVKVAENGKQKYYEIIKEIRDLNDAIADPEVSDRIYKIEDITSKIFKAVEDKPKKEPQIKSFMSYYLPTTLKLLHSYANLEKQGKVGVNVDSTKKNIAQILDKLVAGFSLQLDQLYASDAIDISTDIDVLENMLKKDGLTEDAPGFAVAGGH
ncbi:MAG: 5-bromo-4-chloroindolyl phosphate hydrolysis family protein, partial [Oscillospiraceae bacterium]|nr:5-bromo-4-chloroindolyl phosphate hydrolysis family protein [Oscillospiraceae bacterium]